MGQMQATSMGGQQPQWAGQMDVMGAQQLPDPVRQAREYFLQSRDQFQAANRPPEMRPDFLNTREWWQDLQTRPDDRAQGLAALGPPMQHDPLRFADPLPFPQIKGVARHDGTAEGLLTHLRRQTTRRMRDGGGGGSGGSRSGPAQPGSEEWKRQMREQHGPDVFVGDGPYRDPLGISGGGFGR
jgi:hypothetical protein